VYVWREDSSSRQRSIREIIARATSPHDWPQASFPTLFWNLIVNSGNCLTSFRFSGAHFSRRHLHQPVVPNHVQAWRLLPRRPRPACVHPVPEQDGHRDVDVGGTRGAQVAVADIDAASQQLRNRVPPCLSAQWRREEGSQALCEQRPQRHGKVWKFQSLLTFWQSMKNSILAYVLAKYEKFNPCFELSAIQPNAAYFWFLLTTLRTAWQGQEQPKVVQP